MVAIDPSLGDRDIIQIRKSMVKLKSDGRTLEIIQTSKPGRFGCSAIFIRVRNSTILEGVDAMHAMQGRL